MDDQAVLLFWIILWLGWAAAGAGIARHKGRHAGRWFLVCLLIPIAVLFVALLPRLSKAPAPPGVLAGPSVAASAQRLGLKLTGRHVMGFIFATAAGWLVARILPQVWGYLDPLLTALFGSGASPARDNANYYAMTAITAFTSYYIAYRTFRKP